MTVTEADKFLLSARLRAAADWVDAHPDCQVDYVTNDYGAEGLILGRYGCNIVDYQTVPRALGGRWDKEVGEYSELFTMSGEVAPGVFYKLIALRDRVCERVVVATREVEVPDPDVEDARPLVKRTVEDVEWRCEPFLSRAPTSEPDLSEVPF